MRRTGPHVPPLPTLSTRRAGAPRPRTLPGLLAAALLVAGLVGPAPLAAADHDDLPDGRRLVEHTVQPGETATGLASRYHAWTRELIRHNHLPPGATLVAGQRIEIPVVVAAAREDGGGQQGDQQRPGTPEGAGGDQGQQGSPPSGGGLQPPDGLVGGRAAVHRSIVRTAQEHQVDPQLVLAISWQEAGWRMRHRSSAGAIGALQVLPATGTWMSLRAGRPLQLHEREDNVLAGVLLLDLLTDQTGGSKRRATAAYYQGLSGLREQGMYADTQRYVANVAALKRRIERGEGPRPTGS